MAMYQEIQGLYRAEKKALEITERSSKVKHYFIYCSYSSLMNFKQLCEIRTKSIQQCASVFLCQTISENTKN